MRPEPPASARSAVPLDAARLAEVLMSAAAQLTESSTGAAGPAPVGVPVRSGRVSLGRVRGELPGSGEVMLTAGFGTCCWVGAPTDPVPELGRLAYRATAQLDGRGRLVLPRQVRAWLAVADPAVFEAVVMSWPTGGVLVVPVEGFAGRFEAVAS